MRPRRSSSTSLPSKSRRPRRLRIPACCQPEAFEPLTEQLPDLRSGLVEAGLSGLEAVAHQRFDGVGRSRHESIHILVGFEAREDVVRDRAVVAAPGPADADPETQEVTRAE